MNNDVEENDTTYIFSPFEMYSEDISYQATKQCLQDDENMIEIYYDSYMENENVVTIYAVYKTDTTKVGQIIFTILPDLTTH